MKLHTLLKTNLIKRDIKSENLTDLLRELTELLDTHSLKEDKEAVVNKLLERERLGATSIGNSSAIPHTKIQGLNEPLIIIGLSKKGIIYTSGDKEPVRFFILILSPADTPVVHLQILAAAAALVRRSDKLIREMFDCSDNQGLIDTVRKYENSDE